MTIWKKFLFVYIDHNYAFHTGSVYGFGMKRRQRKRMPVNSESASNLKIRHIVNKVGLLYIQKCLRHIYFTNLVKQIREILYVQNSLILLYYNVKF